MKKPIFKCACGRKYRSRVLADACDHGEGRPSVASMRKGSRKRVFDPDMHCGAPANDGNLCTMRKGSHTDHVGEGRCKWHGGSPAVKHGLYRSVNNVRIREAIERAAAVENPMDLLPEVEALRALAADYMERHGDFKDALLSFARSFDAAVTVLLTSNDELDQAKAIAQLRVSCANERPREVLDVSGAGMLLDRVGKMVERINNIERSKSLTPEKVAEYRDAIVMLVMKHATPEIAKKISDDLARI